jgi:hypothetical protein
MSDTIWNDVYMRKNFQDRGEIPSEGGWACSPDIIPNGIELIADPVDALTKNWNGPDIAKTIVLSQPNYFYVRAKNLSAVGTITKIELYYCPSNLFLYPSLWTNNQLCTNTGQNSVQVNASNAEDIMVPNEPFTFIPSDSEQICLISRVMTGQHPNPLPQEGVISDMKSLAAYIQNHPNIAWRNVQVFKNDLPVFNRMFHIETGDEAGQVILFLECKNIKGSTVSFSSGTPIPCGPDAGKNIALNKTQVTQDFMSLGTQILSLPKNFTTTIVYSYFSNGIVPEDCEINFHAVLLIDEADNLHANATPLNEFGIEHPYLTNSLQRGICIGTIHTIGK